MKSLLTIVQTVIVGYTNVGANSQACSNQGLLRGQEPVAATTPALMAIHLGLYSRFSKVCSMLMLCVLSRGDDFFLQASSFIQIQDASTLDYNMNRLGSGLCSSAIGHHGCGFRGLWLEQWDRCLSPQ